MKKIDISSKISWLQPFWDVAYKMYPDELDTVRKVYEIPCTFTKRMGAYGLCKEISKRKIDIGVATQYQQIIFKEVFERKLDTQSVRADIKKKPFSKLDILETFAHELAHVVISFNHTVWHKRIEHRIMAKFLTLLNKHGYHSEERELGEPEFKR